MYLRKVVNKNGRIYLSIAHNYRDKNTKSTKAVIIKSIGYLDELEKVYDDPISYFTAEAKKMEQQRLDDNASFTFTITKNEPISTISVNRRNFGYAALSKIYHELDIHTFFINRQRHLNEAFDANTIMKMLVYSWILNPASKKEAFEKRDHFFENTDYSLDDLYHCLTFFNGHRDNLHLYLNKMIRKLYGRDTSLVYYYVTNYYFDIEKIKDFNNNRVSKKHRPNPIVQMGLLIDNNGIPITYQLFPGNSADCMSYRPNLSGIRHDYELGKVVIVADKDMTTGDYIWYTLFGGNGYVFSMSIVSANKELKDYILNENGYEWSGTEYKRKSRSYPRTVQVTSAEGRKLKKTVNEKQIVFYLDSLNKNAKAKRNAVIAKARDIIANPKKYTYSTSYGASEYIKYISFDKKTGRILNSEKELELDIRKLEEEEKYDGYSAIVTSECNESDDRIIEIFRQLCIIEESFCVINSDLDALPAYISRDDHIQAHFITCFIAMIIIRTLVMKTEKKYSITQILESLRKTECSHLQQNYYLFDYYDDVLKDIGENLGIDFSNKILSLKQIKDLLGDTKK